jgi:magnesium transporter
VLYVVDERGVLIDDIRMREFLLTSPSNHVADLMDRRFVALSASDDQNTAVTIFRREDRLALPVTDSAGVLIGIVTIDDVLDVAEAEATKEMQRVGGSEALDEPYMKIGFARMIQKRAGWLTALFLGEMLTATAMGAFEREIERAVVLALFVPLIISSGGNSGSQASTLVIRAIALGEVTLRDWWRVARRGGRRGSRARQYSRIDWLPAHLDLVHALDALRPALAAGRGHRRPGAHRRRLVGHARGGPSSLSPLGVSPSIPRRPRRHSWRR